MRRRINELATVFVLATMMSTSGCAYLTTYKRSVDLGGKSIAIDVKQRVVFGGSRRPEGYYSQSGEKITVICAEPSPDALTVLGASGSLSVSQPQGTNTNAAAALAESGASIGLRTQSIQLLRDAMYRLCEGYANQAISQAEFEQMQRRFQSTMMGLIAIEQLTGPVVAGQALLSSSTTSQAGAGAGDAAVKSAQDALTTAKNNQLTAQANLDTANTNLDKAHKDVLDNRHAIATEKGKKTPDPDTLKALTDATPGLVDKEIAADNARKDAARRVTSATDDVAAAQGTLAAAQSRAAGSASSSGTIEAVSKAAAQMQEGLSTAVPGIVRDITLAYEREECIDLIKTTIAHLPTSVTTVSTLPKLDEATYSALSTCTKIVETASADLEYVKQQLENEKFKGQLLQLQISEQQQSNFQQHQSTTIKTPPAQQK